MTVSRSASLAIVGNSGGTNVGESLRRAAETGGYRTMFFDALEATRGPRAIRSAVWHLLGRRPLHLHRFAAEVVEKCRLEKPDILIATGAAPLTASALRAIGRCGVRCVNYSTDDPWNPAMRAGWHLRALPEYDTVFTPRRANIGDLRALGCCDVRYLPFGYDETLCRPPDRPLDGAGPDVLFVGGADPDRVAFMAEFMRVSPRVTLVGSYWERYPATRPFTLGQKSPDDVAALTAAAKVNLCLVRRANRDGHVMRSYEMAAIGACMLVEDTDEHRDIFGPDGECVLYYSSADQAGTTARMLLCSLQDRARLASALRKRIKSGANTYRDRLSSMIFSIR